jgi:DNA-binding beta-propeller fold protein YncE
MGLAENPNTKTVYSTGRDDNTVSVIDATLCNKNNFSGCNQSWPTINVGNFPFFVGVNKITNTIYVSNNHDNTLSVINGATCNRTTTSGCTGAQPTTTVGNAPFQIAVDEATNTIYVENAADGTVSVINGALCNATHLAGCSQIWPTVKVGNSPQGIGLNPTNHTVYVTNTHDNTVSVINGNTCNGANTSGCYLIPAKITVGNAPRSVGVVTATNTVFVGNAIDLTVSVINGATCNGTNTSGCGQTPPVVFVGAFPNTAGNATTSATDSNILGRGIGVDSTKHIIYIPTFADSDVATLDATTCRAGDVSGCAVQVVKGRMSGRPELAIVDESSGTVYVSNFTDGTVSVFKSSSAPDDDGDATGNLNTALGVGAGVNLTTEDNNIDIGNLGVAGDANTIRIGEPTAVTDPVFGETLPAHTATFIAGIYGNTASGGTAVYINSSGQLGLF